MSGPFGYGRSLWGRRPVGAMADWMPLMLTAETSITDASARLRTRPRYARYDDFLVSWPGGRVGRVSAARLFDALARRLVEQATTDALTGLANRSHFLDRLAEACVAGEDGPVVVAFVDLDRMKQVNDTLGHNVGDHLLVSVARRLAASVGSQDVVARLGGDEFAVLSRAPSGSSQDEAAAVLGERLRAAVAARDPALSDAAHSLASVGVAIAAGQPEPGALLREADLAMYQAKRAGGDTFRVTGGSDLAAPPRRRAPADHLRRALHDNELELHYQPIVRLAEKRIVAVEALMRWRQPERGLLQPDQFPFDVGSDLSFLDHWVLRTACADLASWSRLLGDHAPTHVNVNVTAAALRDGSLAATVLGITQQVGLEPHRLHVELPETADLSVLTDAVGNLNALRRYGVGVVLDDMGAGSSTLRHLSVLPVSGLKIDRSFVAGMLDNPNDHAVVKLLTALGHNLALPVTAEGVEHRRQLDELVLMGVPYAQGYLLGRPQPAEQLLTVLRPPRLSLLNS